MAKSDKDELSDKVSELLGEDSARQIVGSKLGNAVDMIRSFKSGTMTPIYNFLGYAIERRGKNAVAVSAVFESTSAVQPSTGRSCTEKLQDKVIRLLSTGKTQPMVDFIGRDFENFSDVITEMRHSPTFELVGYVREERSNNSVMTVSGIFKYLPDVAYIGIGASPQTYNPTTISEMIMYGLKKIAPEVKLLLAMELQAIDDFVFGTYDPAKPHVRIDKDKPQIPTVDEGSTPRYTVLSNRFTSEKGGVKTVNYKGFENDPEYKRLVEYYRKKARETKELLLSLFGRDVTPQDRAQHITKQNYTGPITVQELINFSGYALSEEDILLWEDSVGTKRFSQIKKAILNLIKSPEGQNLRTVMWQCVDKVFGHKPQYREIVDNDPRSYTLLRDQILIRYVLGQTAATLAMANSRGQKGTVTKVGYELNEKSLDEVATKAWNLLSERGDLNISIQPRFAYVKWL